MTAAPTFWLRRAALVGVGFGLVVGARVLGRGEVPEPAPQVEPRSEPPVEAPDLASTIAAPGEIPGLPAPDDPEACAELHAIVAERLDAIQEAASEIEGLEILLSGEPVPWPDDTPATLREDAVRTAFREAAAAVGEGLVLKDLRCEEYPCIGVFERLDDEEGEWWRTDPRWSDALTEKLGDMEATRRQRELARDRTKSNVAFVRSDVSYPMEGEMLIRRSDTERNVSFRRRSLESGRWALRGRADARPLRLGPCIAHP